MTIKEIKELEGYDVIAKRITAHKNEIYYVMFNFKRLGTIQVCQGYYQYDKEKYIFFENTRQDINYDELLLYYDLIYKNSFYKAGE